MDDQTPPNSNEPRPDSANPTPPPRKRRKWPWVLLGVAVFLLALVLLAPTIASTAPVRSIVVGKINQNLNGTVEIGSWSLGWFSPTTINDVKVYDDQKRLILDIPRVHLGLSLLSALRNNFAMGNDNQIDVDSFVVHLDESGKTNLEKLPREHRAAAPKPAAPKTEPTKLPDISGKFTVNFHGTIEGSLIPVPVEIDQSTAVVNVTDINKPIDSSVKLAYHVGDHKPSIVETSGSISTVKDNILNLAELAGGQKIDFQSADLAGLEPLLKKYGLDAKLAGLATGGVEIKANGLSSLAASGEIDVNNVVISGGPLGPDTFRTTKLSIPVKITQTSDSSGKPVLHFENFGLKLDQANISVTGQIPQDALVNIGHGKAPGSDGSLTVTADITDLKNVADQLKGTLHLQNGVAVTGGSIHEQIAFTLSKESIRAEQNLNANVQGTQNNRPIEIKPITFNAGLSAVPTGKAGELPSLADLKLALNCDFATLAGGGESLAKIDLNGNFDLGKMYTELSQFTDMNNLQLQGTGSIAINTNGDITNLSAPIDLKLALQSSGLGVTRNGQKLITDEGINANIAASLKNAADQFAVNVSTLSVNTKSNLLALNKSGDAPATFVLMKNTDAVQGNAALTLAADLQHLANIVQNISGQPVAADQPQLRGGTLNATITLAQADQTTMNFDGQMTGLTVSSDGKNAIENEQVAINLNAKLPADQNSAQPVVMNGKIGSSFVNTTLSDVKVFLQGGLYDKLQSANLDAQAPDLSKLYALANSFTPAAPATQPRGPSTPSEPPLQITSGSASIKANLARDPASKTTTLNLTDLQLTQLALQRGQRKFAFDQQPITFKLSAAVKADQQIDSIQVQQLTGDARIAKIDMSKPIIVNGLQTAQPSYTGEVKITGSIDDNSAPLLALLQNADVLYRGAYQATQQITTAGNTTSLTGAMDINSFKALDGNKKVTFSEDQIAIRNDVDLDLAQHNAKFKTVSFDMAKSKALGLKFTGQVNDWAVQRNIAGLGSDPAAKLDVTYDLEKLWPIMQPMLSPQMQQQYKTLVMKGQFTRSFTVSGSYPDKPMNQAIATLNANGSLAVDYLDLPQGLTIKAFELPFTMKNGILTLNPAPKSDARQIAQAAPAGRRGAPATQPRMINVATAIANDGGLALDQTTIDLTQPDPLLSIISKHPLMRQVKLNPVLADSLGKLGAMIMTNASTAEGLITVTIVKCDKVPLGALIQEKQDAEAQITLAVDDFLLDGPVAKVLSAAADLGTGGIRGNIPASTISLKDGVANTNLTVQISKQVSDNRGRNTLQGMPLTFKGGMGLEKLDLRDFTVTISPDLIIPQLRQVFPNGAVLALKGTASKPQLDLEKAVRENAIRGLIPGGNSGSGGNQGGDILNQLLNGGKNNQSKDRGQ